MGASLSALARQWLKVFLRYFANSDYLAGMLAMSGMAVARDACASAGKMLLEWILRKLWVTVRLEEKDAELVLAWLRARPEVHSSTQLTLYSQCSSSTPAGQQFRQYEYEPEIQVTTRLRVGVAGRSRQWIWIKRCEKKVASGCTERRMPGVTVSFFGSNKGLLEAIIEEGREVQRRRREKYLTVVQVYDYGKEHGLNWLHPADKDRKQPGRSISSVVLPNCPYSGVDQAEALLDDVREFLASELWYTERGIPYRRGYLLHGVPGGGKSSLVMAVASELMLPIYMLQLSSEQMSDETLNSLLQYGMHDAPTILLLEDVDLVHSAVLHRRDKDKDRDSEVETEKSGEDTDGQKPQRKRRSRLTLSGLLNALDGPTSTTGRVLFMTTNAKDRLDPALLRSGRIDYEVEFKEAEKDQVQRLFARFYQDFASCGSRSRGKSKPSAAAGAGQLVDLEAGAALTPQSSEQVAPCRQASPAKLSAPGPAGRSPEELAVAFAESIAASGVRLTTADIQRHLMKRKTDPERALEDLPQLLSHCAKVNGDRKCSPLALSSRQEGKAKDAAKAMVIAGVPDKAADSATGGTASSVASSALGGSALSSPDAGSVGDSADRSPNDDASAGSAGGEGAADSEESASGGADATSGGVPGVPVPAPLPLGAGAPPGGAAEQADQAGK